MAAPRHGHNKHNFFLTRDHLTTTCDFVLGITSTYFMGETSNVTVIDNPLVRAHRGEEGPQTSSHVTHNFRTITYQGRGGAHVPGAVLHGGGGLLHLQPLRLLRVQPI